VVPSKSKPPKSKSPKPKTKQSRREIRGMKLGSEPDFSRSARCMIETIRLRKKGFKKGTSITTTSSASAAIAKRRRILEHLPVLPNPRQQPRTHGANHMMGTPIVAKASKNIFDGVRDRDLKSIKVVSNNCNALLDSSERRIQSPLVGEHAKQYTSTNTSTNTNASTTGSSGNLRQFFTQQEDANRKPQQEQEQQQQQRVNPGKRTPQQRRNSSLERRKTEVLVNEDNHSSKKSTQAENEIFFTLTQQITNNTTNRGGENTPPSQLQSQLQSPSQTPSTSSSAVLSLPMMTTMNHHLFDGSSQFSAEGCSRSQNNHDDEALMIRDTETTERITETTRRKKAADDPLRDLGFWQNIVKKEESRNSKNGARSFKHTLASLVLAKNSAHGNSNDTTSSSTTRKNHHSSNDGFLWLPSILEGGLGHTGLLDDSASYADSENKD